MYIHIWRSERYYMTNHEFSPKTMIFHIVPFRSPNIGCPTKHCATPFNRRYQSQKRFCKSLESSIFSKSQQHGKKGPRLTLWLVPVTITMSVTEPDSRIGNGTQLPTVTEVDYRRYPNSVGTDYRVGNGTRLPTVRTQLVPTTMSVTELVTGSVTEPHSVGTG